MTKLVFPERARREDHLDGHMTVQRNLDVLLDEFNDLLASIVRGSTTLGSGNTSVIAVHSLNQALYSVAVVPLLDPGARYWVSNKTASQFQINLAAAPAGNVPFDWIVKGASP